MSGPEAPRRMSGDHRPGHVRRTDDGWDELRIGPPDEVDPDSLRSLAGVLSELVVSGRRMADAFEAAGRQLSALSVRLERTAGPEDAGEESPPAI